MGINAYLHEIMSKEMKNKRLNGPPGIPPTDKSQISNLRNSFSVFVLKEKYKTVLHKKICILVFLF